MLSGVEARETVGKRNRKAAPSLNEAAFLAARKDPRQEEAGRVLTTCVQAFYSARA